MVIATGTSSGSERISTTSAVSIATSVPAPIATPRSALGGGGGGVGAAPPQPPPPRRRRRQALPSAWPAGPCRSLRGPSAAGCPPQPGGPPPGPPLHGRA